MSQIEIEGLPEGLELVRIGEKRKLGERALVGGVLREPALGDLHQIIVRPAPGFEFVEDAATRSCRVVRSLKRPEFAAILVKVSNAQDQLTLAKVLEFLHPMTLHVERVPDARFPGTVVWEGPRPEFPPSEGV